MTQKSSLFERITHVMGEVVSSHPGKIALAFFFVFLLMLIPLSNIELAANISDFFPENEYADNSELIRTEFNASSVLVGIIEADSGNIMDRQGLLTLQAIEKNITADQTVVPYLVTHKDPVLSIADVVEGALRMSSNGTLGIANAPDMVLGLTVAGVLADRNFSSMVSNEDGGERRYALVMVFVDYTKYVELLEQDDETLDIAVEDAMDASITKDYEVYTTGGWNNEMKSRTIEDLSKLIPISIMLILLILLVSLRNPIELVISMIGLVTTMAISFGLFTIVGLPFNQMTFFAPIVIMVLSIDFGIHILLRFKEQQKIEDTPKKAMGTAIEFMGISILLSALTTIVAFASNAFSGIPAVGSFGIFLAMGISVSFLVMLFYVPSLRLLSMRLTGRVFGKKKKGGKKKSSKKDKGNGKMNKIAGRGVTFLGRTAYTYAPVVVVLVIILTSASIYFGTKLEKDLDPKEMLPEKSDKIIAMEVLAEDFPGMGLERVSIMVEGDISDPAILRSIDSSITNMADDEHVAKTDGVPSVESILTYMRALTMDPASPFSGMQDLDGDGLPDLANETWVILDFLYNQGVMGYVSSYDIRGILSRDGEMGSFTMTRMIVAAYNVEGTKATLMLHEIEDDVEVIENAGGTVLMAGMTFERSVMIDTMTGGMMYSTVISIIICSVMVIVLFWSLRYGIITALPVTIVCLWLLGTAYALGFDLNPVTATTTAMTIGIGIDYSIHLVERYRQEKKKGLAIRDAMDKALGNTGVALLAAGATTASGFGIIAFSRIGMFHTFGVLAFLIIVYVMLATLVILPALLVRSDLLVERILQKNPGLPELVKKILRG